MKSTFTRREIFAELDALDEDEARSRIALGLYGAHGTKRRAIADEWTKAQERKRKYASNSEMAAIASRAAMAAERAAEAAEAQASAAKQALITAIVAAIISAAALAEATFRALSRWF